MTEEKRTVKSYKTLWNLHIWGYTGDKMVFLSALLFIVVGILMEWIFITAVGVGFMWYHLKNSIYWWRRENRMLDYHLNTPRQPVMQEGEK